MTATENDEIAAGDPAKERDWPRLMTTEEAREYMGGMSRDTLYRLGRRHRIKRIELDGNFVRWPRKELDRVLRGMERQMR